MFVLEFIVAFISVFVGMLLFKGIEPVFWGIWIIWGLLTAKLFNSITEMLSKEISDDIAKEFEKKVKFFVLSAGGLLGFVYGGLLFNFFELCNSYYRYTRAFPGEEGVGKSIFVIEFLLAIIDFLLDIVEFLCRKHFLLFFAATTIPGVVVSVAIKNKLEKDEDETPSNKYEKLFIEKLIDDLLPLFIAVLILFVINLLYIIEDLILLILRSDELFIFLSLCILIGIFLAAKVIYDQNRSNTEEWLEWFKRGEEYENRGEYKKALEAYSKVIELNPNFVGGYNNRGTLYYRLGEYENALEDFNKVIELNPNFGWGYYNRGLTYYTVGKYEKALENFNKAI